jgi:hypothetical protein
MARGRYVPFCDYILAILTRRVTGLAIARDMHERRAFMQPRCRHLEAS